MQRQGSRTACNSTCAVSESVGAAKEQRVRVRVASHRALRSFWGVLGRLACLQAPVAGTAVTYEVTLRSHYEVTTKSRSHLRSHVHTLRSHSKSAIGFWVFWVDWRACKRPSQATAVTYEVTYEVLRSPTKSLRSHYEVTFTPSKSRSHPTKSLEVTSEACQCALKGSLSP